MRREVRLLKRLAIALALVGMADAIPAAPAPLPIAPQEDRRHAEVRTFADVFFAEQREQLDIPGAVFVLVERGETLMAAGYGLADRETGEPVHVEGTRFRVASIGKTFTALAALQLVERGVLHLQDNVNQFLSHPIEEAGRGPITLHQLLVHTAGFDERLIGYLTRPGQAIPLEDYLARRMPYRSFPPDDISRYSNHGYALAGLVVEKVSGRPFRVHAEEEIFGPLGMSRTAYLTLPLPAWVDEIATEYWASGEIAPLLVSNPYPAGSLATTAGDMKRFLLAFLAEPKVAAAAGLEGGIRRRMETIQFTHHPRLPGLTYGMNRTRIRGRTVVLKGGSGQCHAAIVGFLPEHEVGFFGAVNRQEPQIWSRLLPRLVELFPETPEPGPDAVAIDEPLVETSEAEGEYRLARHADRSIERLLSLAAHATVAAVGPDAVAIALPLDSSLDGTFERVSGSVFRDEAGRSIAFRAGKGGATHLFLDYSGEPFAFERLRWDETTNALLLSLATAGLLLLSGVVVAAGRGVWRLLQRGRAGRARPESLLAQWVAALGGTLGLATLVLLLLGLAQWKAWAQAAPGTLVAATVLAVCVHAMALGWVVAAVVAWRRSFWGVACRLNYTAGAVAMLLLAVILWRYNVWPGGL